MGKAIRQIVIKESGVDWVITYEIDGEAPSEPSFVSVTNSYLAFGVYPVNNFHKDLISKTLVFGLNTVGLASLRNELILHVVKSAVIQTASKARLDRRIEIENKEASDRRLAAKKAATDAKD